MSLWGSSDSAARRAASRKVSAFGAAPTSASSARRARTGVGPVETEEQRRKRRRGIGVDHAAGDRSAIPDRRVSDETQRARDQRHTCDRPPLELSLANERAEAEHPVTLVERGERLDTVEVD